MVPCKSTAEEVSFEWSHHRILSTDSKVRTTLHGFKIDSGGWGKGLKWLTTFNSPQFSLLCLMTDVREVAPLTMPLCKNIR